MSLVSLLPLEIVEQICQQWITKSTLPCHIRVILARHLEQQYAFRGLEPIGKLSNTHFSLPTIGLSTGFLDLAGPLYRPPCQTKLPPTRFRLARRLDAPYLIQTIVSVKASDCPFCHLPQVPIVQLLHAFVGPSLVHVTTTSMSNYESMPNPSLAKYWKVDYKTTSSWDMTIDFYMSVRTMLVWVIISLIMM